MAAPPPSRSYGRVPVDEEGNIIPVNEYGLTKWVEVLPDASGLLDAIFITTLVQVLRLNLGESPFFGNWGIPAEQSVLQQIVPDYYVNRIQQQFAPYFASLIIVREDVVEPPNQRPVPTWRVSVVTQQGFNYEFIVVPV
jgi:hypothetical protein